MRKHEKSRSPSRLRPRPLALIADDEPLIGSTLVQILQEEGFDALYVSDGKSALFWACKSRPDFVVLDVIMPGLNGIEVAKQFQALHPETRIILFSGHAEAAGLVEAACADGLRCEVLAKPIRPEALLAKMRMGSA